MRFPTDSGQLAPKFDPFGENVLAEIMAVIVTAWSKVRRFTDEEIRSRSRRKGKRKKTAPPVQPLENWITRRLARIIRFDPAFRDIPFDVNTQVETLEIEDDPDKLDLHFKHRHSQRDYFAFEAKRLHVKYPGGSRPLEYGAYTSDKGMGAYVIGQYSEGLPAAGMLGYVMDGETQAAWSGLDASIQGRREPLKMAAGAKLEISALHHLMERGNPGTLLGETLHHLAAGVMRIFHLLVPYPASDKCSS